MEGEVGAQVAPTSFLHHQQLPHGFREPPPAAARKRRSALQTPSHHQQSQQLGMDAAAAAAAYASTAATGGGSWDPKAWVWDSVMCVAEPSSDGAVDNSEKEVRENLALKLGPGPAAPPVDEEASRPAKRVRSRSPGNGGSCASCQVDDCKVNLANAKDYNRRHKVCDAHSKSTKALVGKQMQRFCQQCSRFHLLPEFDGGKRSCRSRLDWHNRRRRKIQPEDASSRLVSQDGHPDGGTSNVHLSSLLAQFHGKSEELATNSSNLPEKNDLIGILSKINSTSARNSSAKLLVPRCFDLNVPQNNQSSEHLPGEKGGSSVPTLDLLPVLPTAVKDSSSDNLIAQQCSNHSGDGKAELSWKYPSTDINSYKNLNVELQPVGTGRGDYANQSSLEVEEHPVGHARLTLSLQMFNTVDDDSPPKSDSSRKLHSGSSNPMERLSSSSPHDFKKSASVHAVAGSLEYEKVPTSRENFAMAAASTSPGQSSPLHLSNDSEGRRVDNTEGQKLPHQEGYPSPSLSDHSPSISNSDAQDRTDRIIFKLSNKQPGDIPQALRTQILSWLSHCPSEMESYIRPGCVVLSVYLSMSLKAWTELQEDLLCRVDLLLQSLDTDFWRSGRFLIQTDQKLASYKDGKAHFCKSWKKWDYPELMLVSPLAVVSGKETPLLLRGRNLTLPGTRIHCTYMGGYISKEVTGSTSPSSLNNFSLESFNFPGGPPNVFGRCYIEVENGLRGNSFPVIVADDNICQELRGLEPELEDITAVVGYHQNNHSREDIMHFLNELGWLFQRRNVPSILYSKNFSSTRFKFLLTFAIERDWLALVKKLLDILVERSSGRDEVISESIVVLSEFQLLSRAVKKKCRKMVDMLLHYFVDNELNTSRVYLFTPNHIGPANFTPLHLAASMQGSEDLVDALTNDPQEIGLTCWDSVKDDTGETPCSYASATYNHSYNRMVARKLADKRNCQLSITVENEETESGQRHPDPGPLTSRSCVQCAILEERKLRGTFHSKGLLYRPFANMLLAIAAVCACVSLMFRGRPELSSIAPFKWSNLGCGPI